MQPLNKDEDGLSYLMAELGEKVMKIPGVKNKEEAEKLLKEKWMNMTPKHKAFFTKVVISEISQTFLSLLCPPVEAA